MSKTALIVLFSLILGAAGACRSKEGAKSAGDAAKPAEASGGGPAYATIGPQDDLGAFAGRKVVIEGRLSKTPWQHMIRWPEGYGEIAYFDFELGRQTVLYAKAPIACDGFLTVWGAVVEIRGESKRPGDASVAVEYHVIVDRTECAK